MFFSFGEVSLLLNERRTATARSETITVLHTLDKAALAECLEDVPIIRDYMLHVAKKRKQRVAQIDPLYSGIVDTTFESDEYVDVEDAKTPLFMYDKAVNQTKEVTTKGRSSKSKSKRHSTSKFGLHFDKKNEHVKMQSKALQRLRRLSLQSLTSNAEKRIQRKNSHGSKVSEGWESDNGGSLEGESVPGSPVKSGPAEPPFPLEVIPLEEKGKGNTCKEEDDSVLKDEEIDAATNDAD